MSSGDSSAERQFDTLSSLPIDTPLNMVEHVVQVTDDDRALGDLSVNELRESLVEIIKQYGSLMGGRDSSYAHTWNSNKEEMLKKWGEEAFGYLWMHHECVEYYEKRDRKLWIPAAILGVMFTGTGLATLGFGLPVFVAALTFIGTGSGTALSAIHAQMKYSKRSQNHKEMEALYSDFVNQIKEELAKDRKERRNGTLFVEWSRKTLRKLMDPERAPNVPKEIVDRYREYIKNSRMNIAMPAIAGGSGHISIRVTDHGPKRIDVPVDEIIQSPPERLCKTPTDSPR
jgi:hypothetical protein